MLDRLRGSFAHLPPTLRLLFASSPQGTLLYLALTLGMAGVPLAVAYAGKRIIDAVVAGNRPETLHWVLIELGLAVTMAGLSRLLGTVLATLSARLGIDINSRILEKAIGLDLRHFEDPTFYDQLTKARREASSRPIGLVRSSVQIVQNTLTLSGYIALLLQFNRWAVLGLVLATIPATIAEVRFSGLAFRLRSWQAPESRRLYYLEYLLATNDFAKEIKLFGLGQTLLGRYRALSEKLFHEGQAITRRRALWGYLLSLLATASFYGCYAYLALSAASGALTLGQLTLYVVAFRQGQQGFQAILEGLGGLYEDNLYMSNLFSYFALTPDGPAAALPSPASGAISTGAASGAERGLRLEGLGFRYPGQEGWALRGITLAVPEGRSLAIVGHNGSGKTTLIKLLTGLYRPTEGRIVLDGRDLSDWGEEALRKRMGVIFQDYNRYQMSVRENVEAGSIEQTGDEERVVRSIGLAGADEVVAGLAKGLDTQLGRMFRSEGVELSGGQWQRVALARAYMRESADILILDEPTAALDAEAEHAVFERFRELTRGRTTLFISHRFPTVRMADRIVVLEHGALIEQGTHDELVAQGGLYARLFALQAAGYR
jgi:ATP-binding cassette subfamily B protein